MRGMRCHRFFGRPCCATSRDTTRGSERGCPVLAEADLDFETCLDIVASATESIRAWNPGTETLAERVRAGFQAAGAAHVARSWSAARAIERVRLLTRGQVGDELISIDAFDQRWNDYAVRRREWFNSAMKHYLAARLFANWIAYQGRGLRTIVEWLRTCAAVVGHELLRRTGDSTPAADSSAFIEAVRRADLLLLHVLDSAAFATDAATIED